MYNVSSDTNNFTHRRQSYEPSRSHMSTPFYDTSQPCNGCGCTPRHDRETMCPAWGKLCLACGKSNHTQFVCRKFKASSIKTTQNSSTHSPESYMPEQEPNNRQNQDKLFEPILNRRNGTSNSTGLLEEGDGA